MSFTDEDYLPCPAELDVPQELNVSAPVLRAAAHHMGKYCDEKSKEFMLCRREEEDPRKCLDEGKAVTACGVEFLMKIKEHCYHQFTEYWQCVDYWGGDYGVGTYGKLNLCRQKQIPYDDCVLENLNQERVHYGYFGRIRLHDTCRPKPVDIPIKHAPVDEPPKEFSCEEIEAVKESLEGLSTEKFQAYFQKLIKDMPQEEKKMFYSLSPNRKYLGNDPNTYGPDNNWYWNANYPRDYKPSRQYTSDFGV